MRTMKESGSDTIFGLINSLSISVVLTFLVYLPLVFQIVLAMFMGEGGGGREEGGGGGQET